MSFNLNRRNFLKTVVVSAGAVVVGATAGCNDDDDNNDANDAKSAPSVLTGAQFFPQSVASGDPKSDSVVLWARVFDSEGSSDGLSVRLQVASDEGFTQQIVEVSLTAQAEQDNCLKVKVTDLAPHTTYYYRFIYTKDDKRYGSSVGRTRTAPAPDADTPVRLAVLNCQDYIGNYYNTLLHLIEQDENLDFILYVGDYIYETTGDPRFQTRGSSRTVKFTDEADAIVLGEGDEQFYAARSLSNYRDIYKTYRGDSVLQRLHERFPVIVMWDDHEYSNDCYRDVATYFNGRKSERDTERRVNAEQAFFEFLPIDDVDVFQTEAFTTPPSKLYPNTVLYRDFQFGRHFHLVLSDYRSFRPDHIIPEDAFPGKVVLDKEALISLFEAQAPGSGAAFYEAQKQAFGPYVDMAVTPWNQYQPALVGILTQAYIGEGLSQEDAAVKANSDLSDKVSAFVFNQLVEQFNTAVGAGLIPDASELPPIDDDTYNNSLDRGIAYLHFGKQSFFTEVGVRYGVVKPSFDLYVSYLYNVMQQQGETPENVFGDTQQAWLNDKIQSNQATFLALVSSVSTASTIIDFSSEVDLPADFQTAFHLNIDDWDGFPHKRAELLETLKNRGDALILSGDVHAAFMTDHDGVVDFTAPAVSSGTLNSMTALSVPAFAKTFNEAQTQRAEEILVTNLDDTLKASFDKLKFAKTHKNGYLTLTVDADKVTGTFYMVDPEVIASSYYDNPTALAEQFTTKTFIYQQNLLTEAST
jgi:alkaline phosphatase D